MNIFEWWAVGVLLSIPFVIILAIKFDERRCRFCRKRKGVILAPAIWEYTSDRYYHEECLTNVLREPHKYRHLVDMAIDIEERIAYLRKQDEKRLAAAELAAKRLDGQP
jgi:hypothetical protein